MPFDRKGYKSKELMLLMLLYPLFDKLVIYFTYQATNARSFKLEKLEK